MKNLFRDKIPKGVMERIRTPYELVDYLESKTLLSAKSLEFLQVRHYKLFNEFSCETILLFDN